MGGFGGWRVGCDGSPKGGGGSPFSKTRWRLATTARSGRKGSANRQQLPSRGRTTTARRCSCQIIVSRYLLRRRHSARAASIRRADARFRQHQFDPAGGFPVAGERGDNRAHLLIPGEREEGGRASIALHPHDVEVLFGVGE